MEIPAIAAGDIPAMAGHLRKQLKQEEPLISRYGTCHGKGASASSPLTGFFTGLRAGEKMSTENHVNEYFK